MKQTTISRVQKLLTKEAANDIISNLGKGAWNVAKGGTKAFFGSGKYLSKSLAEAGVKSPVLHAAAAASPFIATYYGGKAALNSEPVMRMRYAIDNYKYKKALEDQQTAQEALQRYSGEMY